jgi:hypothetical protein
VLLGVTGVFVGVRDGVRVEYGTASSVKTQPFESVTVMPKELAGTVLGQSGSA